MRGTVFEVNLEKGYIYSVDHAVTLKNQLLQTVSLLPGKIASAYDIFTELGQNVLDTAWIEANQIKDQAYNLMRAAQMDETWAKIS